MEKIPSPYENLLQMYVVEKHAAFAKIGIRYRKELCNPTDILHGGVIASLTDAAAAQALHSAFPPGPYMTAELTVRYKNPSKATEIFAAARTSHLQGKVFKTNVAITDSDNTLIAEAEVKSFLPGWQPKGGDK